MSSSVQKQSYQLQPGDLIRDSADGSLGLVLGPGWCWPQGGIYTLSIQWVGIHGPVEMDVDALKNGWVQLVSRADVSII